MALARRLRATTARGSRYDSLADHLLFLSTLGWLALLRPDSLRQRAVLLLIWIGIGLTSLIVGWVKFRRFANLHLYSAKAAVVLGILFVVHLLVVEDYSPWFS